MSWNLLNGLKTKLLYRVGVDFVIPQKGMDAFIGRTAHIKLLDCDKFLEAFASRYLEFFE